MIILGLGGFRRNAAAAIARDGQLLAAVEQKKVARGPQQGVLPAEAIAACLELAKTTASAVDMVAIARPTASESELHLELRAQFPHARVVVAEHHTAHAAAAYYLSGFNQATVLTLDRNGDFRCGSRWTANGTQLHLDKELYYPDSVGDLYSRVTELMGYRAGAEEQKVQWLSAAGQPAYAPLFEEIFPLTGDWANHTNRQYFDGERAARGGFSTRFYQGLGLADGAAVPEKLAADVAASLQATVEKVVLRLAGTGENLCLGGGVFLNTLLVEALERSGQFQNVYVQPSAGNAGTALGALCLAWHQTLGQEQRMRLDSVCLGPEYTTEEIKRVFENCKLRFQMLLTTDAILSTAIGQLKRDRILAWMQGRMEFGSRALGNRSILASPVNPYSTENLNVFIKHREPFRKFAASVPVELASRYFDVGSNARYLATVGRVRSEYREQFASAILGENIVRVHTVSEADNPLYWRLLHKAAEVFGMPVLYNTSFNLFGDPLVCSPRDAVRSFYSSGIDALIAGSFFVEK
ncbi:MAG TPA: carbamoyltransferase C-terminal domain-containing protein [Bryobacteraceae bacterium]|nr:carbamoyltransferase C-terminal domain-containing protein [Bryobacteraceae bacterium]